MLRRGDSTLKRGKELLRWVEVLLLGLGATESVAVVFLIVAQLLWPSERCGTIHLENEQHEAFLRHFLCFTREAVLCLFEFTSHFHLRSPVRAKKWIQD